MAMEEFGIDFMKSEHQWIGVTSYNIGVLVQKETSLNKFAAYLDASLIQLKIWVKSEECDVFKRLQQVK